MDAGNAAPVWVPKSITPHFAALLGEEISEFPVPLGRSEGGSRKPGKGAASLLGVPFPEHLRLAEGEQAFSFCRGGPVPPGARPACRVCVGTSPPRRCVDERARRGAPCSSAASPSSPRASGAFGNVVAVPRDWRLSRRPGFILSNHFLLLSRFLSLKFCTPSSPRAFSRSPFTRPPSLPERNQSLIRSLSLPVSNTSCYK